MAIKELSDLNTTTTFLGGDFVHIKRGVEDLKITAENFQTSLGTHGGRTDNPHSTTKSQVGLGNVTNDAQLKINSNLADLANVVTARTNLGVSSSAELAAAIDAHSSLTNNPHNTTKTHVGLGNVQNFSISDSVSLNSSSSYASSKAVFNVNSVLGLALNYLIPQYAIIYIKADATIPAGWALCDGNNGTPNLVNKFIRCSGSGDDGTTGGSDLTVHSHGGSVLGHTLTIAEIPPHVHGVNNVAILRSESGGDDGGSSRIFKIENISTTSQGSGNTHNHGLTINSQFIDNRPAFYQLMAIMKL
jgi:hypothetical protein